MNVFGEINDHLCLRRWGRWWLESLSIVWGIPLIRISLVWLITLVWWIPLIRLISLIRLITLIGLKSLIRGILLIALILRMRLTSVWPWPTLHHRP